VTPRGALFTAGEVARATGAAAPAGAPEAFPDVSTDTRAIALGALFVALEGERFDAHDFLGEAKAKGAGGAVVRSGTPAVPGLPLFEVDDTLRALGALAALHRRRFRIPVAAVAGSNGKTTTKEMLAAILRTRGSALATEGNLNNEIGVPLTVFRMAPEHHAAVLELGMSAPGELRRLTEIARPDAGVVTLVAAEHLEFLKDLDGVADAEGELYRGLLPEAVAVVNADDARCMAQAERVASGVKRIFFGKSPWADVRLVEVKPLGLEGQEILLEGEEWEGGVSAIRFVRDSKLQRRRITVRLGFVGEHNAMNAAAAAATAAALSYSFEEISKGLAAARPYTHRSRIVPSPLGVTILDDCYNASPASMEAALATLASLVAGGKGRAVAVLGDMLELGAAEKEEHLSLGRRAGNAGLAAVALFGPRSSLTFEEISRSSSSASLPSAHFTEIEPLLAWLRPRLAPGDVLLVKGSRGMKLERVVDALAVRERG
jgi:UDP-N-acetylmuramoyl-tripeptide--D-alanyl-D-alanine ligase